MKGSEKLQIIFTSHFHWDDLWQRPQQVMSRVSRDHDVLWVRPVSIQHVLKNPSRWLRKPVAQNGCIIKFFRPWVLPFGRKFKLIEIINEKIVVLLVRFKAKLEGFKKPVLWMTHPVSQFWAGKLGESLVVYEIMDEYSQDLDADNEISEKEKKLLDTADLIIAGTDALSKKKKGKGKTVFIPCGVEYEHFSSAVNTGLKGEFAKYSSSRIGYVGGIDHRMDWDIIKELTIAFPNGNVILVGPVMVKPEKDLSRNVIFAGAREYMDLPQLVNDMDVVMIPFVLNERSININPTKVLEYMAAKKPIVSTAIPDVVKYHGDIVKIADNPEDFVVKVKEAMIMPEELLEQGMKRAEANSWDGMIKKAIDEIRFVLKKAEIE